MDVIWQLMNLSQVNGLFNLGTGEARSFNDLMRAILSALNLLPNIHYVEMPEVLWKLSVLHPGRYATAQSNQM